MIEHAIEVRIDRPVEEVFAFLTDAANHPRWDSSSVSMTPDRPGPWTTGLEFSEVRRMGPRTMSFRSKVAGITPNERLEIESLTGSEFYGHWAFSPEGTGTILRWSCEMRLSGPARLAERMIVKSFKQTCDENFVRLKELLEATPPT
jgi:uncharacterized protein YndB with AHSA1/START domain